MWHPYRSGETLGEKSSDAGVIIVDEEHPAGARVTLERDCGPVPFAITYGIYGLLFHTCFIHDEAAARQHVDAMKAGLADILHQIPEGANTAEGLACADAAFSALIDRHP